MADLSERAKTHQDQTGSKSHRAGYPGSMIFLREAAEFFFLRGDKICQKSFWCSPFQNNEASSEKIICTSCTSNKRNTHYFNRLQRIMRKYK